MTVGAVLLDWGHTLFDTAGSVEFIVAFAQRSGSPISADEAHRLWNDARVRSRTAEELAKGRDKSLSIHRRCWTDLWTDLEARVPGIKTELYDYETGPLGWSPYLDTRDLLVALHERGIPAVIVSDVPFDLRPILAHYDLHHLVHTYVLSGEHGTIKPELQLFRLALDAVGVEPSEALMVGDNHVNDGAAIDVGIRTLLLPPVPSGAPRGLMAVLDLL